MNFLRNPKTLLILIALLAFLGFLDATFLTIKHYQGTLPPCSLALGCEKVLSSQYATINGIPIALLGSAFYLIVMILSIISLQNNGAFKRSLITIIISGFIVSLILVLIQAFILHAFCQYCLASEAISTILLILSLFLPRSKHNL